MFCAFNNQEVVYIQIIKRPLLTSVYLSKETHQPLSEISLFTFLSNPLNTSNAMEKRFRENKLRTVNQIDKSLQNVISEARMTV